VLTMKVVVRYLHRHHYSYLHSVSDLRGTSRAIR
jgi:hypothetical protein